MPNRDDPYRHSSPGTNPRDLPATTTIEISKEYLHFSSAHFTIFSATEREDLHGHTFNVTATVTAAIGDDGLAFDYNRLKNELKAVCDSLDEKVLLPEFSPHLTLRTERLLGDQEYLVARFNNEDLPFLKRDVLVLPVRNIAVEELAPWVLKALTSNPAVAALALTDMQIRVSSGAGQWAGASWQRSL